MSGKFNKSSLQIWLYLSSNSLSSMLSACRFSLYATAPALIIIACHLLLVWCSAAQVSLLVTFPQFWSENWNDAELIFPDDLLTVTGSLTSIFSLLSTMTWHSLLLSKTRPHWIYSACHSAFKFVEVEVVTGSLQLHRDPKSQIPRC